MMDHALQEQVAIRMRRAIEAQGHRIVFVGSTAVVGLGLYPKTSKDADALVDSAVTMEQAERLAQRVADALELAVERRGWGTLSLVRRRPDASEAWRCDVLVPQDGPIPPKAADRIFARAVLTKIGPTAIPEHIVAMKAVAWGDARRAGDAATAAKYETDLLELRERADLQLDWSEVRLLLLAYPDVRRRSGAEIIGEIFGHDLDMQTGSDPSVF